MSAPAFAEAIRRGILAARKPASPVSMKGQTTGNGYQPENHQWSDELLERDKHGKLVGRDPMDIDLDVLKNAGHPPRRTVALVAAWSDRGDEPLFAPIKEVRDIRNHCLECSAGVAREAHQCWIINCPFWAYRLGRNPHNPRRGTMPTFGSKPSVTTEFGKQNAPDREWPVPAPSDDLTSNLRAPIPEALPAAETPGLAPDTGEAVLSAIEPQKPLRHSVPEPPSETPSPAAQAVPEATTRRNRGSTIASAIPAWT